MPIRINLLAESQALEEMRRRDPVKRAIWIGALLTAALLCWSGLLQSRIIVAKSESLRLDRQYSSNTNESQKVLANKRKLDDANIKLKALHHLASSRFLIGPVLNALQQATVDDVNLFQLNAKTDYAISEEVKAKTNSAGRLMPAKPAVSKQKISVVLEARDNTGGPQAIKFKEKMSDTAYFQAILGKTNEVKMTKLTPSTDTNGLRFCTFTLECKYPEREH